MFSTWRNGSFYGSPDAVNDGMPKDWFRRKTRSIKQVLDSKTTVTMAVLADAPDVLVGYSVIEGRHLHWVYVKADLRRQGIARLLVPSWVDTVTRDLTKVGAAIVAAKDLRTQGEEA